MQEWDPDLICRYLRVCESSLIAMIDILRFMHFNTTWMWKRFNGYVHFIQFYSIYKFSTYDIRFVRVFILYKSSSIYQFHFSTSSIRIHLHRAVNYNCYKCTNRVNYLIKLDKLALFRYNQDESRKEIVRMVNKSQTTLHAHVKVRIIFSRHSWNIRINPLRYTVYTIRKKSFWKLRIQRLKVRNCSWDILDTMRRSFDSIDQTFAAHVNKAYGVLTIEMNRARWYETTEITMGSWKIAWD